MKKLLWLTLFILTISSNVWSQGYLSILHQDSITWYQVRGAIDRIDNILIRTVNDTLINTKTYKKIDVDGTLEKTNFFLREDTLSGKLWLLDLNNDKEFLIMDLSLAVGDTFYLKNAIYAKDSIIIADSVYKVDNKKYIRFNYRIQIDLNYDNLTFIEGIGPNTGLLYQVTSLHDNYSFSQRLLCVFMNEIKVFSDEKVSNENCIYKGWTNVTNSTHNENFIAFPNPVSEVLSISNTNRSKCILDIYNINGLLQKRYILGGNSNVDISFSSYEAGLYLLLFKNNMKILQINKVLKIK